MYIFWYLVSLCVNAVDVCLRSSLVDFSSQTLKLSEFLRARAVFPFYSVIVRHVNKFAVTLELSMSIWKRRWHLPTIVTSQASLHLASCSTSYPRVAATSETFCVAVKSSNLISCYVSSPAQHRRALNTFDTVNASTTIIGKVILEIYDELSCNQL